MLETLDDINWAEIYHSHGTAEDFPHWIRQLTSPDRRMRLRAYNRLVEYSNHQGSIYEVTQFVVPFIIELAINERVLNRNMLLIMLMHIADSSNRIFDLKDIPVDTPESISPSLIDYKQKRAVYSILWQAHPLFVNLLHDRKGKVRRQAAQLLCCFWPEIKTVGPILVEYMARERREDILDQARRDYAWLLRQAGQKSD